MKPILYQPNETQFNTQGVGVLSDVISCAVTEERNGVFELQMVYTVNGAHYEDIKHSYIILAKVNDDLDPQPFSIYRITKPLNGRITVYAEHISYQMSFIPVKPLSSESVRELLTTLPQNTVEPCPFTFWTDKETVASFNISEPKSLRSVLGGERGSILDTYGGEWLFDRFVARLYNARGADNGVTFRYGKNITDIRQEENIANVITGIMPFWKDTEIENDIVMLDEYVVYSENADLYPYKRVRPMDFSGDFSERPSQEELREKAQAYVRTSGIGVPDTNVTVSIVSLWQTEEYKDMVNVEKVALCDIVTVEYPALNVSVKAKVIKTVYDVISERYTTIELGEARSNFSKTLKKVQDDLTESLATDYATKTMLQKSVDRASHLITGGLGGHVVTKLDASNRPQELLVLGDSDNYRTAQQVWRWNRHGLGYSSTGYDGEYGLAMTSDGHIVADFVDTGTLNANVIKAGILSDEAGKNYWDMTTGEFRLASTVNVVDGSDVTPIGDYVVDIIDEEVDQQMVYNTLTNNGAEQGIYLKNGRLYLNATYMDIGAINANLITTGVLNADLITAGTLSADRISGGTLKLGNSITNGVIDVYDGDTLVGHWDGKSFAVGSPTLVNGVYEGNTTIFEDGSMELNSLTASKYIYMNSTSGDSRFKFACGTKTGRANGYIDINEDGIAVVQNGVTLKLSSPDFPEPGDEVPDYEYKYTALQVSQGSYLATLTRGSLRLDYKYGDCMELTNAGLVLRNDSLSSSNGVKFTLNSRKLELSRNMNISVEYAYTSHGDYTYANGMTGKKEVVVDGKRYVFTFAKGILVGFDKY